MSADHTLDPRRQLSGCTPCRGRLAGVLASATLALALTLAGGVAVTPRVNAQETAQNLPATTLQLGMYNVRAEVAQTPAQRQIGLMHRKSLPANAGMLFVFESGEVHCFWMRNTLIPLSIAFIADDGSIVNIADMQPQSDASHCPAKPVRYALEMNQGWFAKHGFKAGSKVQGGPFTAR